MCIYLSIVGYVVINILHVMSVKYLTVMYSFV